MKRERLPLELERKVKRAFQAKCFKRGYTASYILRKMVKSYNSDPEATEKFIDRKLKK